MFRGESPLHGVYAGCLGAEGRLRCTDALGGCARQCGVGGWSMEDFGRSTAKILHFRSANGSWWRPTREVPGANTTPVPICWQPSAVDPGRVHRRRPSASRYVR